LVSALIFFQGFEDILLLDELMERYNSDFAKILPKFSELRCDDAHTICDLAMYNYKEVCLKNFCLVLLFFITVIREYYLNTPIKM